MTTSLASWSGLKPETRRPPRVSTAHSRRGCSLIAHPYLGRPGRVPDTRELVVARFPYVIVYEVENDQSVVILRVLHGHMLWPPKVI